MTVYHMPQTDVSSVLGPRDGSRTFAPGQTGRLPWVDPVDSSLDADALRQPRPAQSPKGFFLPATESMGCYGAQADTDTSTTAGAPPIVLVGVRACELTARAYLDQVMLEGEFVDPAYQQRREQTTVVSCDCVDCAASCFCTAVGGRPFATEGFDVNLTPLPDGAFLVDVATEAGQAWLGASGASLPEAGEDLLAQREQIRQAMACRVAEQNADLPSANKDSPPPLPNDADAAWQQFAADCVECGACTNICPTCHCFYLYDQLLGAETFERVRTWDSCLMSTYHRMAGGTHMKLSPRPKLSSRLANRVLHKFVYSPQQYDRLGCTGCGRCVEACLGAVDLREVLQELGT